MMTMQGSRGISSSQPIGDADRAEFQATSDSGLPSEVANRVDQLEYMADLILELNDIAEQLGCATLAGILAVARTEARIQARSGSRGQRRAPTAG